MCIKRYNPNTNLKDYFEEKRILEELQKKQISTKLILNDDKNCTLTY